MVVSGILLFFAFKNMTIKNNKWINLVAGCVLGIYMIHDHHLVRTVLGSFVAHIKTSYIQSGFTFFLYLLLIILAVFAISTMIEIVRKTIFDKLIDKLAVLFESSKRIVRWKIQLFAIYEKLTIRSNVTNT